MTPSAPSASSSSGRSGGGTRRSAENGCPRHPDDVAVDLPQAGERSFTSAGVRFGGKKHAAAVAAARAGVRPGSARRLACLVHVWDPVGVDVAFLLGLHPSVD